MSKLDKTSDFDKHKFMFTVVTPLIGVLWLLVWLSSSPGEVGRSWLVGPAFGACGGGSGRNMAEQRTWRCGFHLFPFPSSRGLDPVV